MRLHYGWEFKQVRDRGRRIVKGCLIFNWMKLPEGSTSRVGIITTRKLGNSVIRGRARRLLREAFRLHRHWLITPIQAVLVARKGIVGLSQQEVNRDYLDALKKAGLIRSATS